MVQPLPVKRRLTTRGKAVLSGCGCLTVVALMGLIGALVGVGAHSSDGASHPSLRHSVSASPSAAGTAHPVEVAPPAQPKQKIKRGPHGATYVSKAQLGGDWPFIGGVNDGWLGCHSNHPSAMLFTLADGSGRTFALDGTALDAGWPQFPKSIWTRDGSTSIDGLQTRDDKCI